jgi:hypothetical protein
MQLKSIRWHDNSILLAPDSFAPLRLNFSISFLTSLPRMWPNDLLTAIAVYLKIHARGLRSNHTSNSFQGKIKMASIQVHQHISAEISKHFFMKSKKTFI